MPDIFSYDQFNFSGYYIAVYLFCLVFQLQPDLVLLRDLNGVMHVAWAAVVGLTARRLTNSWAGALLATAAVGFSPQLFDDSTVARPDTISTLLVLLFLLVFVYSDLTHERISDLIVCAFLVGFSASIKVTFASFALLLVLPVWYFIKHQPAKAPRVVLVCVGTMILAFACGAPYALVHPFLYVHGVRALQWEYSQGLWPFGLGHASVLSRANFATVYLWYMVGVLNIALFVCSIPMMFKRGMLNSGLLCTLLTAQSPTFFPRNFSHVLPPMFLSVTVLCELLTRGSVRVLEPLLRVASTAAVLWFPLSSAYLFLTLIRSGADRADEASRG